MDAVGIRCWLEMQTQLGISPCVLLSALNDRGVAAACEAHGKYAATIETSPEILEDLVERGYRLLVAAHDAGILREGLDAKLKSVEKLRGRRSR